MKNIREYKYLSEEEVNYYRSMNAEEIKEVKASVINNVYRTNVKINDFRLDEPFHVTNGDWKGVVYKENDKYFMNVFVEIDEGYIDTRDIAEAYIKGLDSNLDIYYINDYKKLNEFYKIYSDKTTYLYGADENCDHEIIGGYNYSGVRCSKCTGWYCA